MGCVVGGDHDPGMDGEDRTAVPGRGARRMLSLAAAERRTVRERRPVLNGTPAALVSRQHIGQLVRRPMILWLVTRWGVELTSRPLVLGLAGSRRPRSGWGRTRRGVGAARRCGCAMVAARIQLRRRWRGSAIGRSRIWSSRRWPVARATGPAPVVRPPAPRRRRGRPVGQGGRPRYLSFGWPGSGRRGRCAAALYLVGGTDPGAVARREHALLAAAVPVRFALCRHWWFTLHRQVWGWGDRHGRTVVGVVAAHEVAGASGCSRRIRFVGSTHSRWSPPLPRSMQASTVNGVVPMRAGPRSTPRWLPAAVDSVVTRSSVDKRPDWV